MTKESARVKAWRKNNPEKYLIQRKRFRRKHSAKRNEYMRRYRIANPEKSKLYYRNGNLKRSGSSIQHYAELYEKQKGECKICRIYYPKLVVDHCHIEKKVRGLLCSTCNSGLGHFKDNPAFLTSAVDYLCR